jgi:hypothetical protein
MPISRSWWAFLCRWMDFPSVRQVGSFSQVQGLKKLNNSSSPAKPRHDQKVEKQYNDAAGDPIPLPSLKLPVKNLPNSFYTNREDNVKWTIFYLLDSWRVGRCFSAPSCVQDTLLTVHYERNAVKRWNLSRREIHVNGRMKTKSPFLPSCGHASSCQYIALKVIKSVALRL